MPRKLLVSTFGGITVRFKPLIALHSRGTERGQEGPTAKVSSVSPGEGGRR